MIPPVWLQPVHPPSSSAFRHCDAKCARACLPPKPLYFKHAAYCAALFPRARCARAFPPPLFTHATQCDARRARAPPNHHLICLPTVPRCFYEPGVCARGGVSGASLSAAAAARFCHPRRPVPRGRTLATLGVTPLISTPLSPPLPPSWARKQHENHLRVTGTRIV
eukprot:364550-Chlamydomonas_euryale.AAC.11